MSTVARDSSKQNIFKAMKDITFECVFHVMAGTDSTG